MNGSTLKVWLIGDSKNDFVTVTVFDLDNREVIKKNQFVIFSLLRTANGWKRHHNTAKSVKQKFAIPQDLK